MKYLFALLLIVLTFSKTKAQQPAAHPVNGDASSGWIPIRIISGRVLVPVTINGHPATAHLVNSVPTQAEKDFIEKHKITVNQAAAQSPQALLNIQIGRLKTAQPINVKVVHHQNSSPQVDIMLGDEFFNEFVVDIDFPNQRVAFQRSATFSPPQKAMALAFKQYGDSRAVSASVEHGPPMFYWAYLGDPAPISVYHSYFAAYDLLKGRPNSVRLGGGPRTPPEAIATLKRVSLAGAEFKQVPAVFPDDSVSGDHPAAIAGHIGLAILSRRHIIFDYGRDKLYIIPGTEAVMAAPFAKDRSGLVMKKIGDDYVVKFVCPGSPAMKAGFHAGDTVIKVDDKPLPALLGTAWQTAAWASVQPVAAGVTYTFTMKDGTMRKLTTTEFF